MDWYAATQAIAYGIKEIMDGRKLQGRKWNHAWAEGYEAHVPHRPMLAIDPGAVDSER